MNEDSNGRYKITVENRLTTVETHLDEIRENHLPHIQAKVDKIMWLLITILAGVAIDLVLRFFQSQ